MCDRQKRLDDFKLRAAQACLQIAELSTIRAVSLGNLDRWNAAGVWCSAHDEWRALMTTGTDTEVVAVMTGTDENANRLRQSPPYTGLISETLRVALLREAGL